MNREELLSRLTERQDLGYRKFQAGLLPMINPETVIGVRTPELKKIAREMEKMNDSEWIYDDLPHQTFEENQIHSFLLSREKDYDHLLERLQPFLEQIDNWAVCDQLNPSAFKKNHDRLIFDIRRWIGSSYPYTVRFAIVTMMRHFLKDDFQTEYMNLVCEICSEEACIVTAQAWYIAEGLVWQPEAFLFLLKNGSLNSVLQNKAIQKARESRRISPELKEELKSYRKQTQSAQKQPGKDSPKKFTEQTEKLQILNN